MENKMAKKKVIKTTRTSTGLKNALFDEIDALRNGTTKATQLNAVSRASKEIVSIARIELENAKFDHKVSLDLKTPLKTKRKGISMS